MTNKMYDQLLNLYEGGAIIDYIEHLEQENKELQNEVRKYKNHNIELMNYIAQLEREYNPALKFEELEEGMWVWDNDFNRFGEWLKILIVKINDHDERIIKAFCVGTNEIMIRSYKENRFYRNEVK